MFWLMRFSTRDGMTATGIWVAAESAKEAMDKAASFDVREHPEWKDGYYVRFGIGHSCPEPYPGDFCYTGGAVVRYAPKLNHLPAEDA